MNPTGDDLRAAYFCCSEVIRSRRRTGAPIPGWLRRHYSQLDAEIRASARGRRNSCNAEESDTLSTMQVAEMLRRPERWVRRHRELLGAHKDGDRWRYPRAAVVEYERRAADGAAGNAHNLVFFERCSAPRPAVAADLSTTKKTGRKANENG